MMAFIKTWKNGLDKKFPDRLVRPLVMTAEGGTILCTRYIRAIRPPEIFLNPGELEITNRDFKVIKLQIFRFTFKVLLLSFADGEVLHVMEELAHYVSLFPAVRDSTLGITDYGLWFTSNVIHTKEKYIECETFYGNR